MRTLTKTLAFVALTASFVAPAYAVLADNIRQAAATTGFINVQVENETVTLTGFVEDNYAKQRAERAAKIQGYDLENYLVLSN